MVDQPKNAKAKRVKAKELYALARKMEEQGDYDAAREYYLQSLALYEDETVKKAYFKLLATIGPL